MIRSKSSPGTIFEQAGFARGGRSLPDRRHPRSSPQRAELKAVAQRAGWQIVEVYEDAGISGSKGRDRRPTFDVMRDWDVVLGQVNGPPEPAAEIAAIAAPGTTRL